MSDKAMLLRDADEAFGELHRAIDGLTDEETGRVYPHLGVARRDGLRPRQRREGQAGVRGGDVR